MRDQRTVQTPAGRSGSEGRSARKCANRCTRGQSICCRCGAQRTRLKVRVSAKRRKTQLLSRPSMFSAGRGWQAFEPAVPKTPPRRAPHSETWTTNEDQSKIPSNAIIAATSFIACGVLTDAPRRNASAVRTARLLRECGEVSRNSAPSARPSGQAFRVGGKVLQREWTSPERGEGASSPS